MRDAQTWHPTKYVSIRGTFRGTRDRRELAVGSRLIADRVAAFYAEVIPRFAGGHLLDLGCGKAPLYGLYSTYCDENTCVDWAQSLHANPHLDVRQDLNEGLQLDSNAYQTVILSDVLEHIRTPSTLLAEINRVLTPDGILLMNVPFLYGVHEEPHDYYRYTRFALADLLADANFEVMTIDSVGGWADVVAVLVAKMFQIVPVIGPAAASAVQWLAARFGETRFGRRVREATMEVFPLGYTLVARARTLG